MSKTIYDAVLLLLEQLTPDEQQALADRLQETRRKPPADDWQTRFQKLISDQEIIGEFSDRREDWYGDDGR